MGKTFDQGKDEAAKLSAYFATNCKEFLGSSVKEAHVRQMLIDPFFEALGWDVRNTSRNAPQYREVIPEDSLDVEGHQKAPDYTFRVGTLPKFYVEAKKCGININADPGPAYQLRRYGWSAKVALSLLTDFEELSVYDCSTRPYPSDKASHARTLYFHYEQYPDRWRELWDVFSREAVWSGAFDRYAASKRKRGTSEVDDEFLKEIEGWRDALARNIALRNANLFTDDLNAAVQMTIDRLVFLRMAEDRGLESYSQLLKLCERADIYPRFMRDLCRRADEKYNSGLFHFRKESDVVEAPDQITPKLTIDDKVFKPILQSLYFEHGSPYHFGVLPVEILGTIYERFLGKVIRLTAGHQAKVEEKPEVRKAGGVYYTPRYIVEYIVKQTVGRQIEGRSPAQLAGGKGKPPLRVLDMACGSGSFLLGAYQCLLDHCLKWYLEHDPEKYPKAVYRDARSGGWRLTIGEKKRLLTTHLFGVDIDRQAVEVSKLSLLLKALEGESEATLSQQLELFHARALPNLAENIKCGNSLIGPDYFTGDMFADPEELKRVNPFDWNTAFPEAMKAGGFDCVIGNPPYALVGSDQPDQQDYFTKHGRYKLTAYKTNLYLLFVERALDISKPTSGRVGYIIPKSLAFNTYFESTRRQLLKQFALPLLVEIRNKVFAQAEVGDSLLFFAERTPEPLKSRLCYRVVKNVAPAEEIIEEFIRTNGELLNQDGSSFRPSELPLRAKTVRLESLWNVSNGLNPGNVRHILFADNKKTSMHKPLVLGRDIQRYEVNWSGTWVNYDPCLKTKIKSTDIKSKPGMTAQTKVDFALRSPEIYLANKVLVRKTADRLIACHDPLGYYFDSLSYGIQPLPATNEDSLFLLGLLNSKLLNRIHDGLSQNKDKVFAKVLAENLNKLPIPVLDLSKPADKSRHDHMVKLVESMLSLHRQLAAAKSAAQKEVTQRQIDATDAQIDRLVYDLYGLTEEEIAIVEGKG
jgi:hypothetical protein